MNSNPMKKIQMTFALSAVMVAAGCKSAETPPPKPVAAAEPPKMVEPKKPVGQLGNANALFQKGDYKGALAIYDQILAVEPDNDAAQFNRAVTLHKSGDLSGAKSAYQAILAKSANDADATVNLGAILKDEGKAEEAIELYKKLLKEDEYNSPVLNNLAILYRQKKHYAKAIDAIHKLLKRDQRNVDAYKNLALVYYDQKKYKLAQTILGNAQKMAEKQGKKDPDILVNLGMIYIALGDNGKAMAAFKDAVEIAPKHVVANYNIGSLALQHRDYVLAEKSYAVVAQAWPDNYEVNTALGYALQGEQKLDEAAKQLEKARGIKEKEALARNESAGDDDQVVLQLWQIYQTANNAKTALKYADEYLKLKNKSCKDTDTDEICGRYNGTKLMLQMANQPPPEDEKKKKAAAGGKIDIFKEGEEGAATPDATPPGDQGKPAAAGAEGEKKEGGAAAPEAGKAEKPAPAGGDEKGKAGGDSPK